MSDHIHCRLSKIVDQNSGERVAIKAIVGRNHVFYKDSLKIGSHLNFRDIDSALGLRYEGEIFAIREEVIRKRDYIIVSTKIRDYYLMKHKVGERV
ncbi:hypothetical protein [Viridibacillus arvi]|uniref:hypothetical protein n=1 Tax=Viridibacillus arvi TaxID=263475 RepID=UPI0034CE7095